MRVTSKCMNCSFGSVTYYPDKKPKYVCSHPEAVGKPENMEILEGRVIIKSMKVCPKDNQKPPELKKPTIQADLKTWIGGDAG